jgi:hypothetical protein
MRYKHNALLGNQLLPVDIILMPEWWHKNEQITFDPDFFYHPLKRVEMEQKKEKILYERWGKYGLGKDKEITRPEIGAVHLAAGFLLSEMLGCEVQYTDGHPPVVLPAHQELIPVDEEAAFASPAFQKVLQLADSLNDKYGYVTGDINWGGILNIAMDLRGESIFLDMMITPDETHAYFRSIARVIERFTGYMQNLTGSTSVSVNRVVKHLEKPVLLHSECSHTMISEDDYDNFLLPYDIELSKKRPFGIHYCGPDPHRMAKSFARVPQLDFLDVGWGGDVKILREHLPDTFLNIRLSPVELANQSEQEIRETITRLVTDSGNPYLTGVCCINIDDSVTDNRINAIFETVQELRKIF